MGTIGEKIKTIRRIRGWSQREVAACLGISIPAYFKIESGDTIINMSRLDQIAAVFEMTPVELMIWKVGDEIPEQDPTILAAKEKLACLEAQLIDLQSLVISLYIEIKNQKNSDTDS